MPYYVKITNMNIKEFFQLNKSVAVAFSGGVDSSVLLFLAKQHAERVEAYYVQSAFQPQFEYEDALKISELLDVRMNVISVDVMADPIVVSNPVNRCYYCKMHIFEAICSAAESDGFSVVLDGTNASDNTDDRPGMKALAQLGVLSPLRECGIGKKEIRRIAKENGLPVADKPSYACLATRIPTGTAITAELLETTEKAESLLMNMDFCNFRIRYRDGKAKLELGKREKELFNRKKEEIYEILSPYYDGVYLDEKERTDE